MCGVAGIYSPFGLVDLNVLRGMSKAIVHRGPDDSGFVLVNTLQRSMCRFSDSDSSDQLKRELPSIQNAHFQADLGIAHRRFSIVDTSPRSAQPFVDSSNSVCVCFNGEIYNYLELRAELQALGHKFQTTSDTEVLCLSYIQWGGGCFAKLNGMWAVAVFDRRDGRLLLSRDRMGKLPLYYTISGGSLYFASEIRALLTVESIRAKKKENTRTTSIWLNEGIRDSTEDTFYEGIKSLPPATFVIVRDDLSFDRQNYWTLPSERMSEDDISVDEACAQLVATVREAVAIRLRADVPVATELSGGIDSSIIAAMAFEVRGKGNIAYTVRFPQKEWNEERFAASVANRFGMDFRVIDAPEMDVWQHMLPFIHLEEEPHHQPNLYTNQVIRSIMRSDGIKVVLNGAAGDEAFGGYGYFFTYSILQDIANLRLLSLSKNLLLNSERNSMKRLLHSILVGSVLFREGISGVCDHQANLPKVIREQFATPGFHQLRNALSYRTLATLGITTVPYWNRSADKTHMGIPVEGRAPFLDYKVIELSQRLPASYLIRDGWHKWILRKAFGYTLPHDVLWRRRKLGFPFPVKDFFLQSKERLESLAMVTSADHAALLGEWNWKKVSYSLWRSVCIEENEKVIEILRSFLLPKEASPVTFYNRFSCA